MNMKITPEEARAKIKRIDKIIDNKKKLKEIKS